MTLRPAVELLLVVVVASTGLIFGVSALAHTNTQEGGPNGDVLDGHDHVDIQRGRGGCDDLLGRNDADDGFGGDSGCDKVRGMEGWYDEAVVCDDGAGNDVAYGGDGNYDVCYGSGQDFFDVSCEIPSRQPTNC